MQRYCFPAAKQIRIPSYDSDFPKSISMFHHCFGIIENNFSRIIQLHKPHEYMHFPICKFSRKDSFLYSNLLISINYTGIRRDMIVEGSRVHENNVECISNFKICALL